MNFSKGNGLHICEIDTALGNGADIVITMLHQLEQRGILTSKLETHLGITERVFYGVEQHDA